jgi:hypothetical protein
MDPQVAWTNLLIAWVSRDWEDVLELSEALLNWLDKDGFPPEFSYPQELGSEINRIVVRATCEFVHQRAASVLSTQGGIPPEVPFSLSCREPLTARTRLPHQRQDGPYDRRGIVGFWHSWQCEPFPPLKS